jgi:hypothetical protein
MSVEQQIKRVEDAIKVAIEQRDWLRSAEWRRHRDASLELDGHLDDAIAHHEQTIKSYENILATLRAR